MTGFQLGGLALLATLGALSLRRAVGGTERRLYNFSWTILCLMGVLALLNPNWTRNAAQLVGVTRGADLVAYLTTLGLLTLAFRVQRKAWKLEQQLTLLTRQLALRFPEEPLPARAQDERRSQDERR